jgi:hypothetical protein
MATQAAWEGPSRRATHAAGGLQQGRSCAGAPKRRRPPIRLHNPGQPRTRFTSHNAPLAACCASQPGA